MQILSLSLRLGIGKPLHLMQVQSSRSKVKSEKERKKESVDTYWWQLNNITPVNKKNLYSQIGKYKQRAMHIPVLVLPKLSKHRVYVLKGYVSLISHLKVWQYKQYQ